MTCPHMNFGAKVATGRITEEAGGPPIRFTVEVEVSCADCGMALEFQGLPIGLDTHGPTMSPDGLEARLVAVPKGNRLPASGRIAAILRGVEGRA